MSGTITRRPTYSLFLLFAMWRHAPWRVALLPFLLPVAAAYGAKAISRVKMKEAMHLVAFGRSIPDAEAEALAEAFADKLLRTVGDLFNISEHVLSRGGAKQGVGLGLSIAARYARLMGGTLTLERNQPSGTIARILLSAAPQSPAIPIRDMRVAEKQTA